MRTGFAIVGLIVLAALLAYIEFRIFARVMRKKLPDTFRRKK